MKKHMFLFTTKITSINYKYNKSTIMVRNGQNIQPKIHLWENPPPRSTQAFLPPKKLHLPVFGRRRCRRTRQPQLRRFVPRIQAWKPQASRVLSRWGRGIKLPRGQPTFGGFARAWKQFYLNLKNFLKICQFVPLRSANSWLQMSVLLTESDLGVRTLT